MESESLHLHDDDDDETVIDLPEWLEQGIDPALRDSDDDAPQVALSSIAQVISSQGISQHVPTPAGSTPVVLTPTGGSTPKDTKDWRDLNQFYASESESEDEEEEGGGEEGSEIDEDSDEDEETSGDEDEEGVAEHDPSPKDHRS
ncbi:hypothetical protein BDR03DRAFT_960283 [Suillus americanus]|nr:hypothetical protein BDR03DRAFT_960283 [Suillus americanus]